MTQPILAQASDSLRGLDVERDRRVGTFINREIVRLKPLKAAHSRFTLSPHQKAAVPRSISRKDKVRRLDYRVAGHVEGGVVGGAGVPHVHYHLIGVYRPVGRALLASAGRKESVLHR